MCSRARGQAPVIGRRCREPDEFKPASSAGLHNSSSSSAQIDHDQTVNASGLCVGQELRNTVNEIVIVIPISTMAYVMPRESAHDGERLFHVLRPERAQRRRLDRRAVRHRIGERMPSSITSAPACGSGLEDRQDVSLSGSRL